MATYTTHQLFGGAITAELPSTAIDASDLRQVPDHQEVFVRSDSLTSTIFEINEFQTPQDVQTAGTPNDSAAEHHLRDVVDDGDKLVDLSTRPVVLARDSAAKYPAVMTEATIISPEIDRSAASTSPLPVSWQEQPVLKDEASRVFQLLLRMEDFATDLCIRVNVPLKEFTNEEEAAKEIATGREMMDKIVESFDIKDTGLFG